MWLRWFEHVQRRESRYFGQRMLKMELLCWRKRGRPQNMFVDVVKEDMKWLLSRKRRRVIGWVGGRWSAVATPEGSSRMTKKKIVSWTLLLETRASCSTSFSSTCCYSRLHRPPKLALLPLRREWVIMSHLEFPGAMEINLNPNLFSQFKGCFIKCALCEAKTTETGWCNTLHSQTEKVNVTFVYSTIIYGVIFFHLYVFL